jgi:hypothetical protein
MIDIVASFVKFAVANEVYAIERLTSISPMTYPLRLCYKLLTIMFKVCRTG